MKKALYLFILISGCNSLHAQDCNALPEILTDGLLAFYPFSDGSLNDFSGNGHHLTNTTTAQPVTDRNGNAGCSFEFDNTPLSNDEFLSTTDTAFLNNLTGMSVSLWYEIAVDDPSALRAMVSRGSVQSCPDRTGQWSVGVFDGNRAVFGRHNSVWQDFIFGEDVTNVWQHVVGTYDQNGLLMKIYFNGVLQQDTASSVSNCQSGTTQVLDIGDLIIGKRFTGKIDDVFIYNRALSQTEITDLYALGSCCNTAFLHVAQNDIRGFNLSPNPVTDILRFTSKENAAILSVEIYNTLGQLVLAVPNANGVDSIDVSNLTPGNYFIKVVSDKGSSNARFIKN